MRHDDIAERTVTMILAGGLGTRLQPITTNQAKPLTPFGGAFRLIDFTLSNCFNSGLNAPYLLTQYGAEAICRYAQAFPVFDKLTCLSPEPYRNYLGTADAVRQNWSVMSDEKYDYVLVLAADHVYKMDYSKLLRFHANHGGDLTVASVEYPRRNASGLGILEVDRANRVSGFEEKPANPKSLSTDSETSLASMGIYVFNRKALTRSLLFDDPLTSDFDFGKHVIPAAVSARRVYAYNLTAESPDQCYWRDVGTIDSYYQAHMELLLKSAPFDPYRDLQWPVYNAAGKPSAESRSGTSVNCSRSASPAFVSYSIVGPSVDIAPSARIRTSILLEGARAGANTTICGAIVMPGVRVPANASIGVDTRADRRFFTVTDGGVTLVDQAGTDRMVAMPDRFPQAFHPQTSSFPDTTAPGVRDTVAV
jgi:glucose-1-phosphate adenylyltransferase